MRGLSKLSKAHQFTILTIGQSTRTSEEFSQLLTANWAKVLVDVRSVPLSRYNPHFNKEILLNSLKHYDIKYIHIPDIGGFRRPKSNSVNLAWKNISFRGYADYMLTKEFNNSLLKIIELSLENCTILMCAEALPWRCHRSLISDALVIRHIKVKHIISNEYIIDHELNEMAHVEGTKITYPLFTKENVQSALGDFEKRL